MLDLDFVSAQAWVLTFGTWPGVAPVHLSSLWLQPWEPHGSPEARHGSLGCLKVEHEMNEQGLGLLISL